MKRLCWIQMMMMLFSFWAMVEGFGLIANLSLIALLGILFIVRRQVNYRRMILIATIIYIFIHNLALTGMLYTWYKGLDFLLPLLALNLSLYNEYLANFKSIVAAESAYYTYLIAALVFALGLFAIKDLAYLLTYIPNGFISLLTLVLIIFVPYLSIMTLSFLKHQYNY